VATVNDKIAPEPADRPTLRVVDGREAS